MGAWTTAPTEPGSYVEWVELASIRRDEWFRITADPEFGDHGLDVLEGAVDRNDLLKTFDATAVPPWNRVSGKRVVAVKVLWTPLMYEGAAALGEPPENPRDVVLRFENEDVVVLSAAGVGRDGDVALGVDSVRVFGEQEARRLAILDEDS